MSNPNFFNLLREAVDLINNGTTEEEGLLKTARSHNLYPDQLAKLGYQYNTAKVAAHMNNNPTDRGGTLPTVDIPAIVDKYSGTNLCTAKAASTASVQQPRQAINLLDIPRMPSARDVELSKSASFNDGKPDLGNTMYQEDLQQKKAEFMREVFRGEQGYERECMQVKQLADEAARTITNGVDRMVKLASQTYGPDMHEIERSIRLNSPLAAGMFDVVAERVPEGRQWKRASSVQRGVPLCAPEHLAIGVDVENAIKNLDALDTMQQELNAKYASFIATVADNLPEGYEFKQAATAPVYFDPMIVNTTANAIHAETEDGTGKSVPFAKLRPAVQQAYRNMAISRLRMEKELNDTKDRSAQLANQYADAQKIIGKAEKQKAKGDGKKEEPGKEDIEKFLFIEPTSAMTKGMGDKLTQSITTGVDKGLSKGGDLLQAGLLNTLQSDARSMQGKADKLQENNDATIVLSQLMTDPDLAKRDPQEVADAYASAMRLAPDLVADPRVAKSTVKQMIQYSALDAPTAKLMSEANRALISKKAPMPTKGV